jgi:hypothetical protein
MAIYVKAYITESGEIKADLPKDHPVGEVTLVIEDKQKAKFPGKIVLGQKKNWMKCLPHIPAHLESF